MEDINQLELAAYILIISNKLTKYKNKTIDNYIDLLEDEVIKTKKNIVLNKVRLTLFNDFMFRQSLSLEECKNYTIIIFHRLLNQLHREFDDFDVIRENAKKLEIKRLTKKIEEEVDPLKQAEISERIRKLRIGEL